jgi:hypothetical protein
VRIPFTGTGFKLLMATVTHVYVEIFEESSLVTVT